MQGYTYEYRTDERPDLNLPRGQRYGFITQEVQEVMPTIVRKGVDLDGKLLIIKLWNMMLLFLYWLELSIYSKT